MAHYRHSQQTGKKKKEEDPDAFMRLSDQEIAGCISDIGVPFSEADLRNPKPQQVQIVFEQFGDLLMNATRDSVDPAMKAAGEDICHGIPDLVPIDVRLMLGFFVSLKRVLAECGVHDFSISDFVRPTYDRLGRIFSYVINFIRFREGHTETIDANYNKAEETRSRIDTLYNENMEMQQRLEDMKRNKKAMEAAVKEKVKRNEELKTRLLELKKCQERVAEAMDRHKLEKSRVQDQLEEKTERLVRCRQESEKLRPYVLQSPAALENALSELSENLAREKSRIDASEKRTRALQTSSDTFAMVQTDVQSCIKVLEEIAVEIQKSEEEDAKAAKNKEALTERGANVREVEQSELMLKGQLQKWEDKIEVIRKQQKEKEDLNKVKMEELWEMQRQIREERSAKSREMDRRKGRIDQTEKKMAELKETIEKEVKDAHEEYLKLESHIKLYITEMEQSLSQ